MADSAIARKLGDLANGDWSIFDRLATKTESERRAVLRWHREAPLTAQADIDVRDAVDDALNRVMMLELGLEIGIPVGDVLSAIPGLHTLLTSSAFLRYIDAYLALSVRFVAERLQIPYEGPNHLNELPAAWPCPPPVPERRAGESDFAMALYLEHEAQLKRHSDVNLAMRFLDGYLIARREGEVETSARGADRGWISPTDYELWLRRLNTAADETRFAQITRGLITFARDRAAFYQSVEGLALRATVANQVAGGEWTARHPLTARFGLCDLYLLARLLRAEVSPTGAVTYTDGSWLTLLTTRAAEVVSGLPSNALTECEEVLRGVLDYTCDLVQNAAEIAAERVDATQTRGRTPAPPPQTIGWRAMYDEELEEIEKQRGERQYALRSPAEFNSENPPRRDGPAGPQGDAAVRGAPANADPQGRRSVSIWSRRVRTGEHLDDLVGLAFSGGGIRSATFNLGVLQRLQELDLLRQVDYLSTVSGGGYIGAWLVGSVRRTRYWLTQPTDWSPSIAHLRRYSNYLSPRTGLMSADTWTMWGSWIRNAALIQVSAVVWLSLLMLLVGLGKVIFEWSAALPAYRAFVTVMLAILAGLVLRSTVDESDSPSEQFVIWGTVVPAWLAAFFGSAVLYASAPTDSPTYFHVLTHAYSGWWIPLAMLGIAFWLLSWCPADDNCTGPVGVATLAAAFSTGVVYLAACAVYWTFSRWRTDADHHVWYAYAFGPSLILLAMTLGVIVMIGMLGRASPDWRREWWTRFGSWMGIYGAGFVAISTVTILGPVLLMRVIHSASSTTIKWTAVIGWAGTVIGGLLAGNSSRPDADRARSSTAKAIGIFARVAALVFIAGALVLVATLAHVVLVKISPSEHPIDLNHYWANLKAVGAREYLMTGVVLLVVGLCCSTRFELNIFGLNQFYRNRLVRCYLGATRWIPGVRKPHRFTGFDAADEVLLSDLRHVERDDPPYRGPFPIVNCALNLGGSSDLALHTRHSASFVMTPLRCGADRPSVGYAPARAGAQSFAGGVQLGQAISVSGAAASPNMGYDTSPLVAFLLTMFNVRLAWWFPNPGRALWWMTSLPFSLWYLVRETFGLADENSYFVNVSDGGHFENLGIYELVRRRCQVIVAADAECDDALAFGSLGRVVRMCQTDFGACIDIDVESIRRSKDSQKSRAHCAVGRITYANGRRGYLIYLKASVTGDEGIDVQQYHAAHPAFPHETTADQFFAEDQFESYRGLGHHITELTFRGVQDERSIVTMAGKLENLWTPASAANVGFVDQTEALSDLWDRLRATPDLLPLFRELHAIEIDPLPPHEPTESEICVCLELIQLMENAFLDLRLDEFWRHPDNQGWVVLFTMWAQSPTFRDVWRQYRDVFGIRFGYFCQQRLGL